MGRIKTTLIKRTSRQLISKSPELFTEIFDENKKVLGNTLSSKKVRNKVAGYVGRLKRQTEKIIESEENEGK